jgi:hypothetical protein
MKTEQLNPFGIKPTKRITSKVLRKDSTIKEAPRAKMLLPVGGLMDVPTATYTLGPDGNYVCKGGMGPIMGFVGGPNSFKTSISDWMRSMAMGRALTTCDTNDWDYDAENTSNLDRKIYLKMNTGLFDQQELLVGDIYTLTEKTDMYLDEWQRLVIKKANDKASNKRNIELDFPYFDKDDKTPMRGYAPTFGGLDSITLAETKSDAEILMKTDIDDMKARTMYMNSGFSRARLVAALSTLCTKVNHFITITAHVGEMGPQIGVNSKLPPKKKLYAMRVGEKLKGVSDNFIYLVTVCWQSFNVGLLNNSSSDRTPRYPKNPMDGKNNNSDLIKVDLGVLRSKIGATTLRILLIMSQKDGVLPELSEYHYTKFTNKGFGYGGSLTTSHWSVFLPSVKIRRTTVRTQLKTTPKLARAVNITSEMSQIYEFDKYHDVKMVMEPIELYNSIKDKGYDWDLILQTRGWHTVNNSANPIPTITTYTLLCIACGILESTKQFDYLKVKNDKK